MTPHRFWHQLPDQPPRDSEIVERATCLKINLWRQHNGRIHGEVIIKCGIGMVGIDDDENDDETEAERQQADGLRFASKLLGEFQKKHPDEGLSLS